VSAEADAVRQAKRSLGQLMQDARVAAKTVLVNTQADLLPMVNDRQHAILVAFGILD
jgi:hypothetical protein